MVTDRYQHVAHHDTIEELVGWASAEGLPLIGIDNLPGSIPLETASLPERCVLVFGQEGPGLSPAAPDPFEMLCPIAHLGSTRSITAGVARRFARKVAL